jgi:hypothetical protein
MCVSQQGEFKNTTKNILGEIHVKSFWPKKLYFPIVSFYRVFGRFSA